jgi:hypothetical protein
MMTLMINVVLVKQIYVANFVNYKNDECWLNHCYEIKVQFFSGPSEHISTFFVTFFSTIIDGRDLIFRHKLHIGTPYRGKRFLDPSDSYFLFADLVGFYTH